MSSSSNHLNSLATIWHVSDDLWQRLEIILNDYDPPKPTGRKRIDARAAFDAIIFRLRSGCQWNHLPTEFPDDSSVHRTFQRWEQNGVLDQFWAILVEECDELGGVNWQWQSARANASKFQITRMWYFREEFLTTEKTVNQVASNETQTKNHHC